MKSTAPSVAFCRAAERCLLLSRSASLGMLRLDECVELFRGVAPSAHAKPVCDLSVVPDWFARSVVASGGAFVDDAAHAVVALSISLWIE